MQRKRETTGRAVSWNFEWLQGKRLITVKKKGHSYRRVIAAIAMAFAFSEFLYFLYFFSIASKGLYSCDTHRQGWSPEKRSVCDRGQTELAVDLFHFIWKTLFSHYSTITILFFYDNLTTNIFFFMKCTNYKI